jgi:modulator of FtsH protease HflC
MKRNPLLIATGVLLLALVVLLLVMFQVRQSEVAVVTTFGRPTRDITNAGPYFAWPPPIQRVYKFDQRVRNFEDEFTQGLTSDNNNLLTTVYIGWRISDPGDFFPKFAGGSVAAAEKFLDSVLRNAQNAVISQHPLGDFVNADEKQLKFDAIENEMRSRVEAQLETNQCGIRVEYLGIKKLGLPDSVVTAVFDQMTKERGVLTSRYQNEGEAEANKIRSQADREAAEKLFNAEAEATRILGRGTAEAATAMKTFQQNPELENFLLRIDALELSLKDHSTLVFDQRTPPFDLFQGFGTNSPSH